MRMRQALPWLLVIVVVAVGGTLLWRNNDIWQASTPPTSTASTDANQPNTESSPAPQAPTGQSLADLQNTVKDLQSARERDEGRIDDLQKQLAAEQGERKLLSDQLGGLAGRLDGLEKARAEYTGPARKRR